MLHGEVVTTWKIIL